MKKNFIISLSLLLPNLSFGKSMRTYEHGTLKLEIAAENKAIDIDLDGPLDGPENEQNFN